MTEQEIKELITEIRTYDQDKIESTLFQLLGWYTSSLNDQDRKHAIHFFKSLKEILK